MCASGSSDSQDRFFCKQLVQCTIAGVFDGHGKYGSIAASTACALFENQLSQLISSLEFQHPDKLHDVLDPCFDTAHKLIKNEIIANAGGRLGADGLIYSASSMLIDAGCTATIVIVFQTGRIICAHVGDSDAVVFPQHAVNEYRQLTGDHSAYNPEEHARITQSAEPHALFVYDSRNIRPKNLCPPVFSSAGTHLSYTSAERRLLGMYRKNIRGDLGTYVASPAPSHTASAMTRCLGAFEMHQFGVCHVPQISVHTVSTPAILVVASDGTIMLTRALMM